MSPTTDLGESLFYLFAYFNDVLRKVSTHPADRIDELLPNHWKRPESIQDGDSLVPDQIRLTA